MAFSLSGMGNTLSEKAVALKPLLGDLVLQGETAVWYARPNTGKTLIALSLMLEAVHEKRIEGSKVYYLNADDTGSGLAAKLQVLDDFGIHCLAPGHKGFRLSALVPAMLAMAETGEAHGTLLVIDTLKKVADLMNKKECREFGQAARAFSMAGGTLLGLAHTNKNRSSAEKLVYAGTTDILEDFDSAYLLDAVEEKGGERIVRFDCLKTRGNDAGTIHYAYSAEGGLTYQERLTSVARTDPEYGDTGPEGFASEDTIRQSIKAAIYHGHTKKMALVATVSKACRVSRRTVLKTLEQGTGSDPSSHLWNFERRERGAHLFYLHPKAEELAEAA